MDYMSRKEHERILHKTHLLHLKIHLILVAVLAVLVYVPFHYKFERDFLREAIETFRSEYASINKKHQLLEMLRTRPLTIGQAMDIADKVIEQKMIPVEIVLAIMKQESEFTPAAVSKMGAKGLMQVMPIVWQSYSPPHFNNIQDPVQNIHVGILYLADLFQKFGNWRAVFRSYYAGPENYNNKNYDWYANAVAKKAADFSRKMEN